MSLKLSVGLSRKVGEMNYGSRGASVNVEMELESALMGDPNRLKDRIRQLFETVRSSLVEELNGTGSANNNGHSQPRSASLPSGNGNAASHGKNQDQSPRPRPATASQVNAIFAIAKSQRLDLKLVLQNRFRATRPEDLSVKQASELIDTLKSSNTSTG